MQFRLCVFLSVSLSSIALIAQSSEPSKVCVAVVSNASTASADLDLLTQRLVKALKKNRQDAIAMDSNTTMEHRLWPTRQNTDEAEDKQCEYTVLTRIVENRAHPAAPPMGRPGGPIVPDLDASATQPGSTSAPPIREEMQIDFALFRERKVDPVIDSSIFQAASQGVSDSFMAGMDRIASRVSREMKKK